MTTHRSTFESEEDYEERQRLERKDAERFQREVAKRNAEESLANWSTSSSRHEPSDLPKASTSLSKSRDVQSLWKIAMAIFSLLIIVPVVRTWLETKSVDSTIAILFSAAMLFGLTFPIVLIIILPIGFGILRLWQYLKPGPLMGPILGAVVSLILVRVIIAIQHFIRVP
jgi:hypothetical protein